MVALLKVLTFIANQMHIIRRSLCNRCVAVCIFSSEVQQTCSHANSIFKTDCATLAGISGMQLNGVNHLRALMRLIAELFKSKVWNKRFVKIKGRIESVKQCQMYSTNNNPAPFQFVGHCWIRERGEKTKQTNGWISFWIQRHEMNRWSRCRAQRPMAHLRQNTSFGSCSRNHQACKS